jgi:TP901 family phage tail tape measure protein
MNTALKIAVILTAYDKMSDIVDKATSHTKSKFKEMSTLFAEGGGMFEAGLKLKEKLLDPAIEAFGEAQAAGNELKASMMTRGGVLDEGTYKKIYSLANEMSDKYKGSTASYLDMVKVLKDNRINEKDVLGGIGEATAKLADFFQMSPAAIAEFSAHMRNDMGVSVAEMDKLMDLVARVHNSGVGKTGAEAVQEMNEFFSKASLGAANLGVHGLEASKSMGALGALFMSRGLSGQTVGNNFRRIFDGLRDTDKANKAVEIANQYGKSLTFFKGGKFLGLDNFVQQIGQLENLNPQAIAAILKPFGGKQGLSTDFLEYLGKEGLKGFKEFNEKIEQQANLDEKLKVIMGGLNYEQGVLKTSWTNLKASFGSSMQPVLSKFYELINGVVVSVRNFLDQNPRVAKFASAFIALASAGLMLFGVVKVIQGIRIAMTLLNLTLAANPFIAVAMAAIFVVSLIYTYWDKIGPYFKKVWNFVKGIFVTTFNILKGLFLNFTPFGLIFKHWDAVGPYFVGLWNFVKGVFTGAFNFVWNLGKFFFKAGANIIKSILDGMSSLINKPIETIKNMATKIRRFLPFSPAKEGALRDIHKIRLVETIADSIKPNALVDKMRHVTQLTFGALTTGGRSFAPVAAVRSGGNGPVSINITLNGGATKQDAKNVVDELKKAFPQLMKQYQGQQSRVGF